MSSPIKGICLNMIVKDESHVILDTLKNLHEKIKLDYYVICDTGSTDNTTEIIRTFFDSKNIQGEIYNNEWKDFGTNRTLAIKHAHNKGDYLLIFDADDSITGDLVLPETLTADAYNLKFGDSYNSYSRPCLICNNRGIDWKYLGVLHEFLSSGINTISENILGDYHIISGKTSSRNKVENKYLLDAELLEREYYIAIANDDSLSNRYSYYCANSFFDAGITDKAIEWYLITLTNNGWCDEKYNACLRLDELYSRIGKNHSGYYYLVKSYSFNNNRVEGILRLIQHYTCEKEYSIAFGYYSLIREYYENDYYLGNDQLNNKLFAKIMDYTFFLPYYMVIVCEKLGFHQLGLKMYSIIFDKMTHSPVPSDWWTKNLIHNFQFYKNHLLPGYSDEFNAKMQEYMEYTGMKPKNKIILIYVGFSKFDWNYSFAKKNAIGGSERAVLSLIKHFPKEYSIIISGDVIPEEYDNIKFIHRFALSKYINEITFDCMIISRYVSFFTMFPKFNCKKLILMAHDVYFMNNLEGCKKTSNDIITENLYRINDCVCLTEWHSKEYSNNSHPELKGKISVINNGIDLGLFPTGISKKSNSFIYTSTSERGLLRLIELWPQILEHFPDAVLNVSSYDPFPRTDLDSQIMGLIQKTKRINHRGVLNQLELYSLMAESEYFLYPCSFPETSCITAMEMIASGVICLYYPVAGLINTIGDYGIVTNHGNEIDSILDLSPRRKKEIRDSGFIYARELSWDKRANEWLNLINKE